MINKITLMAVSALFVATPFIASADTLGRQLEIGMSGSDVSALQTFLASDPSIYPQGLVTGYYGFLTKAAVSNFQSRNGIAAVGRVGPATLPVINLQIANGMGDQSAAVITGVSTNTSRNSASIAWNTSENARGVVYYSNTPLIVTEHQYSADITGNTAMTDNTMRTSQNVSIQGLIANTTYYYAVYTTDQAGNVSMTWPATFQTTN